MATIRPLPDTAIMDIDGVAAYLGVSTTYVYGISFDVTKPHERCQPRHTLPAMKVGRAWRYHRDLIDAWMKGTYRRPDAPPVNVIPVRGRRSA